MAQQKLAIKGKVISSSDGMGLPGVSVQEIGNPKNGVVTDVNGNYQINLSSQSAVLKFSYLGFKTQQVGVNGKAVINIALEEDRAKLDEVVVVGYGQQKKVNLTGSVETARFDDAVNTPVTNSAQLMYGKFSGVQLTQGSGLPGNDGSSVTIRGVGTFGSVAPLVVIDNIQYADLSAFNNLSPSDIETITVLKDAAASAIYGARGANGVILVTTKKGKSGVSSVDYNVYTGLQDVTVRPEYLNAVNYATLKNEHDINLNGANAPIRYSPANIQTIIDGSNPDQYANTNWVNEILRTAPVQNHYLSFSGGNDKTTYRVSTGYLNQQAVVQGKFKSQRFNLSLNLNSKLKDWLEISNITSAYWKKFQGPTGGPDAITGETGIINQFERSSPTIPAYYSNGNYGIVDGSYQNVNFSYPATNPLRTGSLGDYKADNINLAERLGAKINFTKDLTFETSGSLTLTNAKSYDFNPIASTYDYDGNLVGQNATNTLKNGSTFNYRILNENILRYAKTFNKKHNFSALAGYSASYDRTSGFTGSLQGFTSNTDVQVFNVGGTANPNVNGGANEVTTISYFSRLNYDYEGKYLLEVDYRADGSSKFNPGYRYGYYPAFSAGWRISEEQFMKNIDWISELKIRGSLGATGNDGKNAYISKQTYNGGLDYYLGSSDVGAVAQTIAANPIATWEKIVQTNIGFDADLFKNRLSLTADYYQRKSSGVLYNNFPIPSSIGISSIQAVNAADMTNKGFEASINYRGKVNELNYGVGGSITTSSNKVTSLGYRGIPTIGAQSIVTPGQPYNSYYGYRVIGIFQSQAEVDAAPKQFGNAKTAPGDLQYADLAGPNGSGPDGIIDANDRTVIGNPYPKLMYNMNLTLGFKGFDFGAVFQGLSGVDRFLNDNGQQPFPDDRNNVLSYWVNRWTPTNPSTTLPRLGGQNNSQISTFYIEDGSYLRLKNAELGYTLPTMFTQKYGINRLRIYISGQNLLTFTKMKNFDPERPVGNDPTNPTDQQVPLYKVYTLGLNLKF
ncbi:TonB-dependent receptor [Pedobacter sp. SD-b]|uniref:TonB-dependent receptor n=1 Tax=Pedobacter segetis TaxID=2793069 RepID=A0ABS1BLX4_9SPHI|nr:TonB-dependent receptor [Pedobacter segetis]MBK0383897.1 TonB-dependent receptor [Pedobacter segetis]